MEGLPLYIQVRNSIKEGLERGIITPDANGVLPSQQHFAGHFKVGLATVKRAIRDLENEGLVTSRRGRGLVLNGIPTRRDSESKKPTGVMPHVGVAFFDVSSRTGNPYFQRLIRGMEAFSDESHVALHIVSLPGLEMEVQEDVFLSRFSFMKLDGVLLLSSVSTGFVENILRRQIPYVSVNVIADRGDVCHIVDFVSNNFKVVDAVLSRGLTSVLFFAGNETKLSTYLKLSGHKLALAKHGLKPDSEYVVYEDYNTKDAVEAVKSLLKSKKRLNAVIAYDDMMGAEIYDFLASKGRKDVLVAGFGNYAGFEDKVKITLDERLIEIGYNSLKMLFEMIGGTKPDRNRFCYDSVLIERDK